MNKIEVEIIEPYGFCLGVKQTLEKINSLIESDSERKIILLGSLIHNEVVIKSLQKNGVSLIEGNYNDIVSTIDCIHDKDAIYVLSAHGHYSDITNILSKHNLDYVDATCPYIKNIHNILKEINKNKKVLYIGNINHIECQSSIKFLNKDNFYVKKDFNYGDIISNKNNLVIVNQSTYYIKDLINEYEDDLIANNVEVIDNFCPSIMLRISNLEKKVKDFKAIIVVGSKTSSNANTIFKYCQTKLHKYVILINDLFDLNYEYKYLSEIGGKVAIISATSATDDLVIKIKEKLENFYLMDLKNTKNH